VEILTCAATHGFLPLMMNTKEAVRAQVQVATTDFRRIFGYDPEGIWLPECGYFEGIETFLVEAGLRYSFLEAHGLTNASPSPSFGVMAPIMSTGGIAFFGRDLESSRQVWSSEAGYPGDPDYREFYKDAGYELPVEDLLDFMNPDDLRRPVGLKRHRVSGKVDLHHKQPYVRSWAMGRVAAHAGHFVDQRRQQAEREGSSMPRPPLIVSPYDAELFGHWWFEGPQFLEQVFRNLDASGGVVALTPSAYLAQFDECEVATPQLSTWGAQGYSSVWLDESNDWIYPHYDSAARRMVRLANRFPEAGGLLSRALNQAARELLLAQSSDWAFIMKTGTMVEYATARVTGHLQRFADLASGIEAGALDETAVSSGEADWPIFPALDYRVFATPPG
jgi:1,4-alpha-glucan branching enzyme